MCGITGIAAFSGAPWPSRDQLQRMCDTLIHRGPDEEGLDLSQGVALGMRRLSIIDVAGGSQPIFNEDRTVRTVFNGEIYNFQELRRTLTGRGHVFRTRTDTEVIVHSYEEYGSDFPRYLNGMFAIALHDSRKRKLILSRDQLGIKPLYFAFARQHLIWGSEIKALLASGWVDRELDLNALGDFLTWEYVPGQATLLKAIRKLEPASTLEIDLNDPRCEPKVYWDISPTPEKPVADEQTWMDRVEAQMKISVQRQLVSDVPLGAFLSGGVDSSLVVACMGRAKTFSIGFDDPTYNELKWARKVAEHLGVDHIDEIIKPEVLELFDRLMHFLDDPIADFSIFPTFLVSRLARRHVTVVLSGDGGDELFGGYETYVADGLARHYQKLPGLLRRGMLEPAVRSLKPRSAKKGMINMAKRFVEGLEHPQALGHARWRNFLGEAVRRECFTAEALGRMDSPAAAHILDLFARADSHSPLNRSLYVDLKSYLSDNILVKVDRMSMAVSLEARVPYLDTDMVELAFQVPERFKVKNRRTKLLLKKVAARRVPRECVYRPKEGFSIPMKTWLNGPLRPLLEELLDGAALKKDGLFRPETVERLKQEHQANRANHSHILWALIVFQSWKNKWLNGHGQA
jgi:asparagine synthase (glutamine-hydrolysing)